MRTHLLLKGFRAAGSIQPRRIVAISSGSAIQAADHHSALIGVADNAASSGQIVSVVMVGVTEVLAGGAIDAGDHVSADASGRAIPATNNKTVVGIAMEDAVLGDLLTVALSLSNH